MKVCRTMLHRPHPGASRTSHGLAGLLLRNTLQAEQARWMG